MRLPAVLFACMAIGAALPVGCSFEKSDSSESERRQIVGKLADKLWERQTPTAEGDGVERESWSFAADGSGSWRIVRSYDDGKTTDETTCVDWFFTSPECSVICIVYGEYPYFDLYWTIDQLTAKRLCVYETYDDPAVTLAPGYRQYREYNVAEQ